MSNNSGDPFPDYKASSALFTMLPPDQQKDIENFLRRTVLASLSSLETPSGEWNCNVGKWLWVYTFDGTGSVTWKDPYNGKSGKGSWKMGDTTMRISWVGSKSWDIWTLPLNPEAQGGSVNVAGEGLFALKATKRP